MINKYGVAFVFRGKDDDAVTFQHCLVAFLSDGDSNWIVNLFIGVMFLFKLNILHWDSFFGHFIGSFKLGVDFQVKLHISTWVFW